ncbi:MAG: hypothetical protein LUG26_06935 [Ruminococcus sp.]|nr:hypothetical protein [Ruminococcus sp.]
MFCISINHKSADVEIRKKLAFPIDTQIRLMKEICQLKSAEQCVVLCTCNRMEIYFSGASEGLADIQRLICKYGSIGSEELMHASCSSAATAQPGTFSRSPAVLIPW